LVGENLGCFKLTHQRIFESTQKPVIISVQIMNAMKIAKSHFKIVNEAGMH